MANLGDLVVATEEGRLLDMITAVILRFNSARSIRALSDATILPSVLSEWVAGRSFESIFTKLRTANMRVGRHRVTIEDVVALCESGFGYDVAMIVASLADLAEPIEKSVCAELVLLQRQIKHGLSDTAALSFLEAGFADRFVSSMLGLAWPDVVDRAGVSAVCRGNIDAVRGVLAAMPSYFTAIAEEFAL